MSATPWIGQRTKKFVERLNAIEEYYNTFVTAEDREVLTTDLQDYIEGANEGNWEGYSSHDLAGAMKFLEDLKTYMLAIAKGTH